jgi:hypothetical protein
VYSGSARLHQAFLQHAQIEARAFGLHLLHELLVAIARGWLAVICQAGPAIAVKMPDGR